MLSAADGPQNGGDYHPALLHRLKENAEKARNDITRHSHFIFSPLPPLIFLYLLLLLLRLRSTSSRSLSAFWVFLPSELLSFL